MKKPTMSNALLAFFFALLFLVTFAVQARAQYGSLPIGSMSAGNVVSCPGGGWYHYGTQYVNCYSTTVTGCTNAHSLGLTYGYLNPVGLVPHVTKALGVVILHTGSDGTAPGGDPVGLPDGDFQFVDYYFTNGYVIVQLAWDSAWQLLVNPWPVSTFPLGNIQYAACRPATFFNWVFNNIYLASVYNSSTNPTAGFCMQGSSAGSAAIAYAMTYYKPPSGTQWWVDNLELLCPGRP